MQIFLILLFPITFLLGKFIIKNAEEEINEIKETVDNIIKILLLSMTSIITNMYLSNITSVILTGMLLIYLILNNDSPKEKTIIAILMSISIIYMIELMLLLGLVATLLKGINTPSMGERIFTKHTMFQTMLFLYMISFKFLLFALIL